MFEHALIDVALNHFHACNYMLCRPIAIEQLSHSKSTHSLVAMASDCWTQKAGNAKVAEFLIDSKPPCRLSINSITPRAHD